ncbi:non-ribosomal peptide synthetase, partial [Nocardia sienata]|uniref:non-ribosomal peptide synthetase n=1 Tax=Nocardia sienata TaxID=248552 RepID=UPI0012EE2E01
MFTRTVEHYREATAVVFGDSALSYGELAARVNRLARYLIARGVGPESLVAVAVPRSTELIVALLAVLEAGGGYLPVDVSYPAERLAFLFTDADPVCVLTTVAEVGALPAGERPVVLLDDPMTLATLADLSPSPVTDADRQAPVDPDAVAYLIYTSGSTGTPKGVLVSHRNVLTLFANTRDAFGFDESDVWTMFHSYAFDFSVWELWGALLYGGTLVIVDYFTARSPEKFLELLRRERVTVLSQTPTAFYQLAEAELVETDSESERELSLRYVIFGGEALDLGRLQRWYARFDETGPMLVNMYGITESTVHVTCLPLDRELASSASASVIGRGIAGLRVVVLDAFLRPVPPGVEGEMYVSGAQLTRGYLGRAGLTATRFVADPYGAAGERMYRTGDRARWQVDGQLEYLGRSDFQVKVRGFRVELGEIESVLVLHPAVAQAVVITRDIAAAEPDELASSRQLVGYVVLDTDTSIDGESGDVDVAAELRGFAAERLPEYMVPAAVVVLDRLPLTVNGKLDRTALPAPDYSGGAYRAPSTPTEEAVAAVFAEVLEVTRVGADDDFFDRGGDSLTATRLVSRIRSVLGVEVPIRVVFESPTVAGLAPRLWEQGVVRAPLVVRERPQRLPLSYAQRRLWFIHRYEGASATYNIPLAVRLRGVLDVAALRAAIVDVVARHESLRTIFVEDEGVPFQQVLPVEAVPVDELVGEVVAVTESERAAAVAAVAGYRFDLSAQAPVRARILRCAAEEHVLVLVIHHIAGDGASIAPLARDVACAYAARSAGTEPGWTPLPVQYADYTLWQREWLGSEEDPDSVLAAQFGYWRQELDGAPEQLRLPTDRRRPAVASYRGAEVAFTLTPRVLVGAEQLARELGATVSMVLQSALAVLLHKLGAGDDIPIGGPIAGRTDEALTDLVGFFVNTWVLRVDTSQNPRFGEVVARVREKALAAYENQDAPFERLVELLNPTRSTAYQPLFQVMFALQNNPFPDVDFPGLQLSPEPAATGTAKFDLFFSLTELPTLHGEPQGVQGSIEYASDLFDPGTVEQIAARYVRLLETVVADPELRIDRFDILVPGEREQLLQTWNDTTTP